MVFNLKNILTRNKEFEALFHSLLEKLHANIAIEDVDGNILFQYGTPNMENNASVKSENRELGKVKGDENAPLIAGILAFVMEQEMGRKNMGKEVLNLYKEINLIFNFSDKLANTIDIKTICETALNEAGHVIEMHYGTVVLWNDNDRGLKTQAATDNTFFEQGIINKEFQFLRTIVLNGQSEIASDMEALRSRAVIPISVRSVMYSALRVKHRIMGAIIIGSEEEEKYNAASLKLLTSLALQASSAIESSLLYEKNIRESREREETLRKVYEAASKFVPAQFIRALGSEVITDVHLGDQVEKMVTVLFTDIRNYTTLSEQMTPEETFRFINSFNERMGPVIRSHHGFINQYLGDSIMAIFPDQAEDALLAAVQMQNEVKEINKQYAAAPIQIGIGMHTGLLIMGITGDQNRLDACTISDTVNTASRLESLTKHFKADILISDSCLRQIIHKEEFYLRNLGQVQLKGKQKFIGVHECFNSNPPEMIQNKKETLKIFRLGVSDYEHREFSSAFQHFSEVVRLDPEDLTAAFFLNHTLQIMRSESKENRDGVLEMKEK